ncbi:hypothetical protein ABPG74_018597 [Tetrahymena malaccensis]
MAQKQFLLILLIVLISTSNVLGQCRGFIKARQENKNSLSFVEKLIANLCEYTNISESQDNADQNNFDPSIDYEQQEISDNRY